MIKINLCPIDELETPYWYLPDVIILVLVCLLSYYGVDFYFASIQEEINSTQEKIASLQASTNQLAPDLERFKSLDNDVRSLSDKLKSLQKITVSKMEKFTPIIALEHIQNLKPQGLWYTEFSMKNAESVEFSLKGIAFDNLMTAELLTSMRATAYNEIDPTDLRSQVFFDKLTLIETAITTPPPTTPQQVAEQQNLPPSSFDIKGIIRERAAPVSHPSETPNLSSQIQAETLRYAHRDPPP
jgi:hypothetical protein